MIAAIIQARISSTRLPKKVMLDICGKPMLSHVIERVSRSRQIDRVVVATSINDMNDPIRDLCSKNDIICYSGSENDVLDRYYQAAKSIRFDVEDSIVRITSDCPLIDPGIIDLVIENQKHANADYTSNVMNPRFPDGLDCEVFKFGALENAWEEAELESDREHVTQYIRHHPETFKITSVENDIDLSHLRWTVDEEEDFILVKKIYEKIYYNKPLFLTSDILEFLEENPIYYTFNKMHGRNEGLTKSLLEDQIIKRKRSN